MAKFKEIILIVIVWIIALTIAYVMYLKAKYLL